MPGPLTDEELSAGRATRQEIFRTLNDSVGDLQDRMAVAEGGLNRLQPLEFAVAGVTTTQTTGTQKLVHRLPFNVTVMAVRLLAWKAGTSGVHTIDLQYKRGGGAWSSILTTPLTANYSAGDYALTSAAPAITDLLLGDLVRLNISTVQVGGEGLSVYVELEAS